MKRELIIATAILLCSFGCRSTKPIIVESHIRDSIYVKEVVRDTVVLIEPDSSLVRALIECDSLGKAYISQIIEFDHGDDIAPPIIYIEDNILTSKAIVDSMEIFLKLKDIYSERVIDKTSTKVVEVNNLTTWQNMMCSLGHIALGAIMLFAIRLSVRLFRKRFSVMR